MKALVTGGAGFLGSHLVERLVRDGEAVRVLARETSRLDYLDKQRVEIVKGDLKDEAGIKKALRGIDTVFHVAAATNGSWKEHLESTIHGTELILSLAYAEGIKRLVHISSLSIYAVEHLPHGATVRETEPYEPDLEARGYYTRAKVESEKCVFKWYQEKKLPVCILRPGIIFGPRGNVFLPNIGFAIKNKLFVIIGRGRNLLPLTYVENVVDAILAAAKEDKAIGQAYNIVDESTITQEAYLKEYLRVTETNGLRVKVPYLIPYVAAWGLEYAYRFLAPHSLPPISRYRLACACKSIYYDNSKAKIDLGWRPKIKPEEAIQKTFEWYLSSRRKAGE